MTISLNKIINLLRIIIRYCLLFLVYGSIYFLIECAFKRSVTDIRMFILGAILAICIGLINNIFTYETNFILQCIVGSIIITLLEAIMGYQWNIVENRDIWNYSNMLFNAINGQICLEFSLFAWIPLSGMCIVFDDILRYYVFKQDMERSHYKITRKIDLFLHFQG